MEVFRGGSEELLIACLNELRLPNICLINECVYPVTTIVHFEPHENPTKGTLYIGICEEHHQKAKEDFHIGKKIEWLLGIPTMELVRGKS